MANKNFVRFAKKLLNNSSSNRNTPQGQIGYDNPRENIDPHIKTQVLNTKEIVSGAKVVGDFQITGTLSGGNITAPGDNLGNHIATQTISGQAISMSGEISGASFRGDGDDLDIPLNTIENPEASKIFNFGNNKYLTFTSVDRTPVADEGIFNWECSGNFTGDLCHMHQHTGNAGVGTVLLRLEAADADICPLYISGANNQSINANHIIGTSNTLSGANVISTGTISGQDIYLNNNINFPDADAGINFNSGTNEVLKIGRIAGAAPTQTKIDAPVSIFFAINNTNKLSIASTGLTAWDNLDMNDKDIKDALHMNATGTISGLNIKSTNEGANMDKVLIATYEGDATNNRYFLLGDDYDEVHIYLEEPRQSNWAHLVDAHAVKDTYGVLMNDATIYSFHENMANANAYFQGFSGQNCIKLGSTGASDRGTNYLNWTYRVIAKKYNNVVTSFS